MHRGHFILTGLFLLTLSSCILGAPDTDVRQNRAEAECSVVAEINSWEWAGCVNNHINRHLNRHLNR